MHCRDGDGGGNNTRGFLPSPRMARAAAAEPRGGLGTQHCVAAHCGNLPGMGILAGLPLKRDLSLYGAKFAAGRGNRVGSTPVAPLTLQEPACPSQALTCPLTLWMGVPRVGSQGPGHCPNPGHPTVASRGFLFKGQLPLFLPFHLFPSAAGTPSVSAGQQSIASEFHPDPTPNPAPGTAWK